MILFMSLPISYLIFLISLPKSLQQTAQCDLDNSYLVGDIAIPTTIDSEPLFQDDYSKVLTPEELALEDQPRRKRAAVRDRSRIWPDNTIPYVIDDGFNAYHVTLLRRAMKTWEDSTCIRFVARTVQQDYIHIKSGRRCCSFVGRLKRGGQKLSLERGCMKHGILLHEFGHVMGFWHEQNRPDRDEYIKVIPNFQESKRYNFDKRNESEVSDYGVPYDYGSIMHYGKTFFSMNGDTTLLPLKEGVQIGQRSILSPSDILQANRLYMCQKDCSWTYNASESSGSFQSMNYPDVYPPKINCVTLIEAAPDHVIRVTFETIDIEHHSHCTYDYIEVRDGNFPTSPLLGKFCGELPPKNFTSSSSHLWIKFRSDSSVSKTGFFAHFVAFDKNSARASKVDPCELKTCFHDCEVLGGFASCTCPKGFSLNEDGFSCSDFNECMNNNGGCSHICMNSKGGYSCMCPRGYLLGDNGRTCQDIDECSSGEAGCSQLCTNTPGSYYCDCEVGYSLSRDHSSCIDQDECKVDNGGCQHSCHNNPGGRICSCLEGYSIDPADKTSCLDQDECKVDNGGCQHSCHNNPGGRICSCLEGYSIDPADKTSCLDIDECKVNNGNCDQQCVNKPGSFQCECFAGFSFDFPHKRCVDQDECNDGDNGGCDHFCHDLTGSRFCSCRAGFVLDGPTHCIDVNECQSQDIQCEMGWCVNDPGRYHCACAPYHTIHPHNPRLCVLGLGAEEENLTEDNRAELVLPPHATTFLNPVCRGQAITSGEPGILTSPYYPLPYPTNTKCSWLVRGGDNEQVQITILEFDLEHFTYCRYDSLRIYDGTSESDPFLANMCGTVRPRSTITSASSNVLLKFTSDSIYTRPGFKATVDFLWDTCGGRFAVQKESRPIQWSASQGSQCLWSLTAARGSNILLKFVKFSLSGSSWPRTRCGVDETVDIYNTDTRTIITSFCRGRLPPKLFIAPVARVTVVARVLAEDSAADLLILFSATAMTSS